MINNEEFATVTEISFQTSIEHEQAQNYCNPSPTSTFSHPSKPIEFTRTFAFDQSCIQKLHNLDQSSDFAFKPPVLLRLFKPYNRNIKSEYYHSTNEIYTDEPSLIQMKYHDGRPTLIDQNVLKSFEKSHRSDVSYCKRIINRLQTFLKPSPTELSRPWQHKTIFELFKTKINRD